LTEGEEGQQRITQEEGAGEGSSKDGMVDRHHTRRAEPPSDREQLCVRVYNLRECNYRLEPECKVSVYLVWGEIGMLFGSEPQSLDDGLETRLGRGELLDCWTKSGALEVRQRNQVGRDAATGGGKARGCLRRAGLEWMEWIHESGINKRVYAGEVC